jgi:hypothetical protein
MDDNKFWVQVFSAHMDDNKIGVYIFLVHMDDNKIFQLEIG